MRRRAYIRALSTAVAGSLAVATAGCASEAGPRIVEMTDGLRFVPDRLTVDPGTTVEWVNVGTAPHTVTAYEDGLPAGADYFASGGFDSERAARERLQAGLLREDEAYRHTFEVAGRFDYFCIPHESTGMRGTVRVR